MLRFQSLMLLCLIPDRKIYTLHTGQASHATSHHRKSAKSLQKKKTLSPCTCRISMQTTLDAGESPSVPCGTPQRGVKWTEGKHSAVQAVQIHTPLPLLACVRTVPLVTPWALVCRWKQPKVAQYPAILTYIFVPLATEEDPSTHQRCLKCWRVWSMMAALCCLLH